MPEGLASHVSKEGLTAVPLLGCPGRAWPPLPEALLHARCGDVLQPPLPS